MNYELYDILTINEKEYTIASIIVENNFEYFLLVEMNNDELNTEFPKIKKRPLQNNFAPERLYDIEDEVELKKVSRLLENAMLDDLKEVE